MCEFYPSHHFRCLRVIPGSSVQTLTFELQIKNKRACADSNIRTYDETQDTG